MRANGSAALKTGVSMADLIRRPELGYEKLAEIDPDRPDLTADIRESVEISIRYEGYIRRQKAQVEQFKRMENRRLPEDLTTSQFPRCASRRARSWHRRGLSIWDRRRVFRASARPTSQR